MPYDPMKAVIPTRLAAALTIVVLLVLLVSVSNIAGILTARSVSRSSEIAVRRVLGAGGLRIARQLVLESLLLAAAGGLAGLLLAHWLLALFHAVTPLQYTLDASIDWRAVVFSAAACVACGLLVGVAPAVQAMRLNILPALAHAGATTTRRTRRRLRHAIVLPQVALSLMLLLVAGVYVRALMRIELTDRGYNPANVVVVSTALRSLPGEHPGAMGTDAEPRAERVRRYYGQLLARVQALPGIDAAIVSMLPLHATPDVSWTVTPAEDYEVGVTGHAAMLASVSPGYFQTMRMRVLHGREFDARDTRIVPPVSIISASLAERLWPGRDPIGRSAALVNTWPGSKPETFEVVGVVNEVQPVLHDPGQTPFVYFAMGQQWQPATTFVIARSGDPQSAMQQVRSAVAAADPFAEAFRPRTLAQMIDEILYPRRIAAAVLFASGWLAVLLASVGIYGVMSYSVAERLGEIGVRRALGAEAHDIARLVIGEGLKVAAIGSLAGLVLGYAAIRITSSRFLALPQIDLAAMGAVPLVLGAVVLLACSLPARRAMRVDPMQVLRRN